MPKLRDSGKAHGLDAPSLKLWAHYFPRGEIFGLDFNDFTAVEIPRARIFQADASSPAELHAVMEQDRRRARHHHRRRQPRVGPSADHARSLVPGVAPGGIYIIEDLFVQPADREPPERPRPPTCFGGRRSPANFAGSHLSSRSVCLSGGACRTRRPVRLLGSQEPDPAPRCPGRALEEDEAVPASRPFIAAQSGRQCLWRDELADMPADPPGIPGLWLGRARFGGRGHGRRWRRATGPLQFMVVGDWGRDGAFHQRQVAAAMGEFQTQPARRQHRRQFLPARRHSIADRKWDTSFQRIYTDVPQRWYAVLGNHDYGGSVEAQIAKSFHDPRWRMPGLLVRRAAGRLWPSGRPFVLHQHGRLAREREVPLQLARKLGPQARPGESARVAARSAQPVRCADQDRLRPPPDLLGPDPRQLLRDGRSRRDCCSIMA